MTVFWYVVGKFTDVSEALAASIIRAMIALMMEASGASEKSVNVYQTTRRNIPEDNHLHIRRRENLKSRLTLYDLHC
jgi:hypothetical protein